MLSYCYMLERSEVRELIIYTGAKRNELLNFIQIAESSMNNSAYSELDYLNCKIRSLHNEIKYDLSKNKETFSGFIYEGISAYHNIEKDLDRTSAFIETKLVQTCPLVH